MNVDVYPGESIIVLSTERLKHISQTYRALGDECSSPSDRQKWHEMSDDIEEWIKWSLQQSLLEMADDEE